MANLEAESNHGSFIETDLFVFKMDKKRINGRLAIKFYVCIDSTLQDFDIRTERDCRVARESDKDEPFII